MTQISVGFADQMGSYSSEEPIPAAPSVALADAYPRPKWLPLPFLFPVMATGMSWAFGGSTALTDFGFALLSILCLVALIAELGMFARRWGMGGCVGFGGILIWFSYDYMTNWFGHDFNSVGSTFSAVTIAKAAFMHSLFIFMMVVCLTRKGAKWMSRALQAIPEPTGESFYLAIIILTFLIGIIPLLFFTSEGFFLAVYHAIFGGRGAAGVMWTAGRTGNLNYSWGGYLAQVMQIGTFGGQFAAFYAMLITRSPVKRTIAWADWAFWAAIGFGTGGSRRTALCRFACPAAVLSEISSGRCRKWSNLERPRLRLFVMYRTQPAVSRADSNRLSQRRIIRYQPEPGGGGY